MGRVLRFVILIIVGFGLGAGLAWFQKSQQMAAAPAAVVLEQPATADVAAAPDANASDQNVAGSSVGGAFSLTDHNGIAVTDQSWPGKLKLVFFGFTACPDICPVALDKMTNALNTLGADAAQIQPLFITVDPARDNAEAMKNYLLTYHSSIVGLTGTEAEVKAAEDAYKVYASKGEADHSGHYNVDHSGYVYLLTEDNKLLEIFGSDSTPESMVEKIKPHLSAVAAPADTTEGVGEVAAPVTEESTPAETVESAPAVTEDAPAALDLPVETPVEAPAAAEGETSTEVAPASETTEAPVSTETGPVEEQPATDRVEETVTPSATE